MVKKNKNKMNGIYAFIRDIKIGGPNGEPW